MDKIEQINKLARKGRDLFEKDHENYPDEDYPNEELECFFDEIAASAQLCHGCRYYRCKNYDERASKKLEALKNVIQTLEKFFAGEISYSEANVHFDMEYRSTKECTLWEDWNALEKYEDECMAWQWSESNEEESEYDDDDEENMDPYKSWPWDDDEIPSENEEDDLKQANAP